VYLITVLAFYDQQLERRTGAECVLSWFSPIWKNRSFELASKG
jgi:hypothetical protein